MPDKSNVTTVERPSQGRNTPGLPPLHKTYLTLLDQRSFHHQIDRQPNTIHPGMVTSKGRANPHNGAVIRASTVLQNTRPAARC